MGIRFDVRPEAVYPAKVVEVSKSTTRNNLSFLMTALLPNKQGEWPAGISGKMLLDASCYIICSYGDRSANGS